MTIKSFRKVRDDVQPIQEHTLPPANRHPQVGTAWDARFPNLTAMGVVPAEDFERATTSRMRNPNDPPRPRMSR